uniref:Uncharacterized protein n=1 Tax=Arundo donax TaxID=35708 RepID=A0A0A8YI27_ARUDO
MEHQKGGLTPVQVSVQFLSAMEDLTVMVVHLLNQGMLIMCSLKVSLVLQISQQIQNLLVNTIFHLLTLSIKLQPLLSRKVL